MAAFGLFFIIHNEITSLSRSFLHFKSRCIFDQYVREIWKRVHCIEIVSNHSRNRNCAVRVLSFACTSLFTYACSDYYEVGVLICKTSPIVFFWEDCCFILMWSYEFRLIISSLSSYVQEANSYKIAVRPEKRRQFHRDMVSSVQNAFDLLSSCLSEGSIQLREQVRLLSLLRFLAFLTHIGYLRFRCQVDRQALKTLLIVNFSVIDVSHFGRWYGLWLTDTSSIRSMDAT